MKAWVEHLRRLDPTSDYLELGRLGTPDEEITTILDAADHYEKRWDAIRTHASQTSPYGALPQELQRAFLATDRLVRLRPVWTNGPIEDVLFTAETAADPHPSPEAV